MGVVYQGLHIALDRRVAVKTLRQEMSNDADLATRFEREARAASAIGHPHIIDVFDLGRTPDGLLFMVMEFSTACRSPRCCSRAHCCQCPWR